MPRENRSAPRERPILFSGPMVRAILDGRKTVTRRVVKGGQIPTEDTSVDDGGPRWNAIGQRHPRYGFCVFGETEAECAKELGRRGVCPYGQPGDRLWLKETWACLDSHKRLGSRIAYRADTPDGERVRVDAPWVPSIHMPRWASRIQLEITDVRVERLQDISAEQAHAEGYPADREAETGGSNMDAWLWFRSLWEEIAGPGSYADNPWVWVVEFKRVTP